MAPIYETETSTISLVIKSKAKPNSGDDKVTLSSTLILFSVVVFYTYQRNFSDHINLFFSERKTNLRNPQQSPLPSLRPELDYMSISKIISARDQLLSIAIHHLGLELRVTTHQGQGCVKESRYLSKIRVQLERRESVLSNALMSYC